MAASVIIIARRRHTTIVIVVAGLVFANCKVGHETTSHEQHSNKSKFAFVLVTGLDWLILVHIARRNKQSIGLTSAAVRFGSSICTAFGWLLPPHNASIVLTVAAGICFG